MTSYTTLNKLGSKTGSEPRARRTAGYYRSGAQGKYSRKDSRGPSTAADKYDDKSPELIKMKTRPPIKDTPVRGGITLNLTTVSSDKSNITRPTTEEAVLATTVQSPLYDKDLSEARVVEQLRKHHVTVELKESGSADAYWLTGHGRRRGLTI